MIEQGPRQIHEVDLTGEFKKKDTFVLTFVLKFGFHCDIIVIESDLSVQVRYEKAKLFIDVILYQVIKKNVRKIAMRRIKIVLLMVNFKSYKRRKIFSKIFLPHGQSFWQQPSGQLTCVIK